MLAIPNNCTGVSNSIPLASARPCAQSTTPSAQCNTAAGGGGGGGGGRCMLAIFRSYGTRGRGASPITSCMGTACLMKAHDLHTSPVHESQNTHQFGRGKPGCLQLPAEWRVDRTRKGGMGQHMQLPNSRAHTRPQSKRGGDHGAMRVGKGSIWHLPVIQLSARLSSPRKEETWVGGGTRWQLHLVCLPPASPARYTAVYPMLGNKKLGGRNGTED